MKMRYIIGSIAGIFLFLSAGASRADFFGDIIGIDSVSVPDDGSVFDELEADDRPDVLAMIQNRARIETLMQSLNHGELRNEVLSTYLNGIMARIVSVSPYPDIKPRVHVLSSIQEGAHSAPDGSIWLSFGTILTAASEDELAFILAHEYAHTLFEHWDSEWFDRTQYYGVLAGRGARELGNRAEQFIQQNGGAGANGLGIMEDLNRWVLIGTTAYKFSSTILTPAWERDQEDVADALGLDLMVRAEYDHDAIFVYLMRLRKAEADQKADIEAQRGSDLVREKRMEEAFRSRGLGGILAEVFSELESVVKVELDDLGRSHYSAEDRLQDLRDYLFREYLMGGKAIATPLPWQGYKEHPVAALIDRHLLAHQAGIHLDDGEIGAASRLALRAIRGIGSGMSFSRLVLYEVRKRQGRPETALRNLEIAMATPNRSSHIQVAYVDVAAEAGEWEIALARLNDAERRLGNAPGLLPSKITIYHHFGNRDEAEQAFVDCLDYHVQDFMERCKSAYLSTE